VNPVPEMSLIAVIGDEDTVTGMLLAGVGHKNAAGQNYLVVNDKTTRAQIEEAFTNYTKKRPDVAIVLINQHVASSIRYLIDAHKETIPTVLEIPSKDRKSSLLPCFPQFHRVCLCEGYPPPLTLFVLHFLPLSRSFAVVCS
jgi:V-type H+-transporting ATPase subunit F